MALNAKHFYKSDSAKFISHYIWPYKPECYNGHNGYRMNCIKTV